MENNRLLAVIRARLAIVFLLSFTCLTVFGQSHYTWLNRDISTFYESKLYGSNHIHTSIKPYLFNDFSDKENEPIECLNRGRLNNVFHHSISENKRGDKRWIDVGPAFFLGNGFGVSGSDNFQESSYGAVVRATLGSRLSFGVQYLAGVGNYPKHAEDKIIEKEVVPGEGYAYRQGAGFSNSQFQGWVSYSPSSNFNFQIGKDKNFWGDGYRSLLLSDYAISYPFLKITTDFWKFKYVNLYTAFTDINGANGNVSEFKNKYGAFHYLSLNVTNWLNIGFFESIVWRGRDSSGFRGYELNYLNPVIFYRPVEYAQGSSDNSLMGLNMKLGPFKGNSIYGQLVLDEFLLSEIIGRTGWWGNKYGFQIGYKSFDVFGYTGLNVRAEHNLVRPYTYSHGLSDQNYSHFNQPLAHPLGANFHETIGILQYCFRDFITEVKFNYAVLGADTGNSNWGGDIFMDYTNPRMMEYGNVTTQGVKSKIQQGSIRLSYLLSSAINLRISAQYAYRHQSSVLGQDKSSWIMIGLRTDMGNRYLDF